MSGFFPIWAAAVSSATVTAPRFAPEGYHAIGEPPNA
jgi:hypothetical protein